MVIRYSFIQKVKKKDPFLTTFNCYEQIKRTFTLIKWNAKNAKIQTDSYLNSMKRKKKKKNKAREHKTAKIQRIYYVNNMKRKNCKN